MPRLLHHISVRYQDAAHCACLSPKIQYASAPEC